MSTRSRILPVATFVLAAQLPSCSDREEPVGVTSAGGSAGSSGRGGAGGSSGGGGGFTSGPCVATDPVCYGNRDPAMVESGTECMAAVDNSPGGELAERVQWRRTWVRPLGRAFSTEWNVWSDFSVIRAEACFAGSGIGGMIEIFDWDRSEPDIERQTVTSGFTNYTARSPAAPALSELSAAGLCFVEWDYTSSAALGGDVSLGRWQALQQPPLAQPWHVAPVSSRRLAQDFDVDTLRGTVPSSEGRVYIDEERGTVHGYIPFSYITVLVDPSNPIALPIRELEIRSEFNDGRFNCIGSFHSNSPSCSTQWQCKAGSLCPPDSIPPPVGGGETGPSFASGYHLIVDLERIWIRTLEATGCVSYQGVSQAQVDGWSGSWGKNCRGSPKWDPDREDDLGLPMGDWCSRTNGPADATCHDAFRYQVYSTGQAFKVQPATPPAAGQSRWTGTCGLPALP